MTVAVTTDELLAAASAAAGTLAAVVELTPTAAEPGATGADLLPGPAARGLAVAAGEATLVLAVAAELAAAVEQEAGDLLAALGPALEAAAGALGAAGLDDAHVLDAGPLAAAVANAGGAEAVDLVADGARLGALVVLAGTPSPGGPAPHDFAPIGVASPGAAPAGRSLDLLGEVEMGVTAELGRTRLLVREIMNLVPGSVIELDRTAGSPVDVLVNGTLIARGEVVVVDEEFGIRITEIVGFERGYQS